MRVVYEPVEDGVGQCRVVHCLVPVSHRQLACGHGRTASVSVIQQLEQVLLLGCRQLRQPPIVQYKDVDASHLLEQLQIATVAVCNGQVFEQAWQPVVCAGQRPDQVGSNPTGARIGGAISKDGGNASSAGMYR